MSNFKHGSRPEDVKLGDNIWSSKKYKASEWDWATNSPREKVGTLDEKAGEKYRDNYSKIFGHD